MGFSHIPRRANLFAPAGYMCGCWRRFHSIGQFDSDSPLPLFLSILFLS
nr:MAG TPA: hypothetical protein [Caudoviricetes sp.]DAZ42041.1 MAG TPA: hypothetical protein [Caudoviricetes sp.]